MKLTLPSSILYDSISYHGQRFSVVPTIGDGNCFYRALASSHLINTDSHVTLRTQTWNRAIAEYAIGNPLIHQVFRALNPGHHTDFGAVARMQCILGNWATNLDMVIVALVNNVRIVCISNYPSGFQSFDTTVFLNQCFRNNTGTFPDACSVSTIYVYHHQYGHPFVPSHFPNHFSLLLHGPHLGHGCSIPFFGGKEGNIMCNVSASGLGLVQTKLESAFASVTARSKRGFESTEESVQHNAPSSTNAGCNPSKAVETKRLKEPLAVVKTNDSSGTNVWSNPSEQAHRKKRSEATTATVAKKNSSSATKSSGESVVKKQSAPSKVERNANLLQAKAAAKTAGKEKKQSHLLTYMKGMKSNANQIAEIEAKLAREQLRQESSKMLLEPSGEPNDVPEEHSDCSLIITHDVTHRTKNTQNYCFATSTGDGNNMNVPDDKNGLQQEANSVDKKKTSNKYNVRKRSTLERTWHERSSIIFFHLHPLLGNCDAKLTCKVFEIKLHTFHGWLTKRTMVVNWYNRVADMKLSDFWEDLPNKISDKLGGFRSEIEDKGVPRSRLPLLNMKQLHQAKFVITNQGGKASVQAKRAASKSEKSLKYITSKDLRIHKLKRNENYKEVKAWVVHQLDTAWNLCLPLSMQYLFDSLQQQFTSGDFHDFFFKIPKELSSQEQAKWADKRIKVCRQWLRRVVKNSGYSERKKSVSQKIPENWRSLAEQGAARVRETFANANVEVVINCDETFITFHHPPTKYLARTGEKRIGVARKFDEKNGCTVMVSMEMHTSSLLKPFIIFKGVFGGRLMKQWATHNDSTVVFNSNHWQTEETMKIYLHSIRQLFPGKVVGIVYDYAPSHTEDLSHFVAEENKKDKNKTVIVLEYIDKCLTSIYQPCDVTINRVLKQKVKSFYSKFIASKDTKPGDKLVVDRANLVSFIETAHREINQDNVGDRYIAKSFRTCGLNPFDKSLNRFKKHLENLQESTVYKVLQGSHSRLDLNVVVDSSDEEELEGDIVCGGNGMTAKEQLGGVC